MIISRVNIPRESFKALKTQPFWENIKKYLKELADHCSNIDNIDLLGEGNTIIAEVIARKKIKAELLLLIKQIETADQEPKLTTNRSFK